MTDTFRLECEYQPEAQLKECLRQAIFRIAEDVVTVWQKDRALRSIRAVMEIPDLLWRSGFFEDLTHDERKKASFFRVGRFRYKYLSERADCS